MKKPDLFQDMDANDRADAIAGLAVKTDSQNVRRHYSHDEKSQMKESLVDDSISLREKKKEFAVIKKEFDKAAKAFSEQIGMACEDLKRGYSENQETVYLIADHDNDCMDIYDKQGVHLHSRKLYPDERQTTIIPLEKTGTND